MQRAKRKPTAGKGTSNAAASISEAASAEFAALRKQLLDIIVRREEQRKAK